MAVFRCKMCGGTLEFENESTAFCGYCGTRQTLPRLSDERRAAMYDKANTLRLHKEFDKATGIFEQIVTEDPTDAESYWSLVLCRFGIDYVEDPLTAKRIPTVNRAQKTSIFDDINYKLALEHADICQKGIYEEEAAAINEIQKGILSISDKEEPFDVFICYKDSDENGERTPDSLLAEDIYNKLTNEGLKVFFSRITLEDKLGSAYEPYIFAALNSSKVMIAVGTKKEHFEAVWVKNEWSRYLTLIREGADKILIPAYRDMSPYDLPEEFAHLQAQDMSKIAFMHDLTRAVKKIAGSEKKSEADNESRSHISILVKRAFMALEDREFAKADEFCEQILNENPENTSAYLCKLLAEYRTSSIEELSSTTHAFDRSGNYKKLIRFADDSLRQQLNGILDGLAQRKNEQRLLNEYNSAVKIMNEARSEAQFNAAAQAFQLLQGYRNSNILAKQCSDNAQEAHLSSKYSYAVMRMNSRIKVNVEEAKSLFEALNDYKDSKTKAEECNRILKEIKKQEKKTASSPVFYREGKKKKKPGCLRTIILIIIICSAVSLVLNFIVIPDSNYNKAVSLIDSGNYSDALELLSGLDSYKDTDELIDRIWNETAVRNPVAAGFMKTFAIKDGEIISIGDSISSQYETDDFRDIIDISAGNSHFVALDEDGIVSAAGTDFSGQCAVDKWYGLDIVAVSAGYNFTVALKSNATAVAIGDNACGQLDVEDWSNIMAISAGGVHTVALRFDGTVVATGDNAYGQCDVEDWSDIIAVSTGRFHTVGLKSDGTCVAVGRNTNEVNTQVNQTDVSEWTDIIAISAGDYHTVGLKSDGTVVSVGCNTYGQSNVSHMTDIKAISAGPCHTVALKNDGTVVCSDGHNTYGHLSTEDWEDIG